MVDKTNFVAKADDLYAQAEKKLKGKELYNTKTFLKLFSF